MSSCVSASSVHFHRPLSRSTAVLANEGLLQKTMNTSSGVSTDRSGALYSAVKKVLHFFKVNNERMYEVKIAENVWVPCIKREPCVAHSVVYGISVIRIETMNTEHCVLEVETQAIETNGNHTYWCGKEIREISGDTKAALDALTSFVDSRDALISRVKKDWFVYGALATEVLHLLIAPFDPNGVSGVPDLTLRDPKYYYHSGEATMLTEIAQLFRGFKKKLDEMKHSDTYSVLLQQVIYSFAGRFESSSRNKAPRTFLRLDGSDDGRTSMLVKWAQLLTGLSDKLVGIRKVCLSSDLVPSPDWLVNVIEEEVSITDRLRRMLIKLLESSPNEQLDAIFPRAKVAVESLKLNRNPAKELLKEFEHPLEGAPGDSTCTIT